MVGVPPPVSTTTSAMPPPPPTFSPKSIDRVLLTADQLSKVLGINVTDNPAAAGGGSGAFAMNSSSSLWGASLRVWLPDDIYLAAWATNPHFGVIRCHVDLDDFFVGHPSPLGGGELRV
jgi:hypothetical protein